MESRKSKEGDVAVTP